VDVISHRHQISLSLSWWTSSHTDIRYHCHCPGGRHLTQTSDYCHCPGGRHLTQTSDYCHCPGGRL